MSINQLAPCKPERNMWRWVVSLSFLVQLASSKPATEVESARQSRQLDFGECCPCPDNIESSATSQGRWLPQNQKIFLERSGNNEQFPNGMGFSQSGDFDNCPCRGRDADSVGSSSIFFPSALHPTGALPKSTDSKEDPKNLLEPEVGLASSVLETLREVTDEEYRDALARDAARSRATEDATPEESAQNMVTIILPRVGDNENIIPEPTHIQEPRCINPLGSSLSRMRIPVAKTPNPSLDFFRRAKSKPVGLLHKNSLDMDSHVGASNIYERIVDTNVPNNQLEKNPISMKSFVGDVCNADSRKSSGVKLLSLLERENESPHQFDVFKSSNSPDIKMNIRTNEECERNADMNHSATDIKDTLSDLPNPVLYLKPLVSENSPLNLKKLLKLRDVELIPPGYLIEKLKLTQSTSPISSLIENMPKLSDLFKNGIKLDLNKNDKWSIAKNDDKSLEDGNFGTNIQVIPRDKTFTTDILDTLPSTSNINEVQDSCLNGEKTLKTRVKQLPEDMSTKTEVIESFPTLLHQIENIDHSATDNDLDQQDKCAEDDCGLTSLDNISSNAIKNGESTSHFERKDMQSYLKNNLPEQDFAASNCLETIHSEVTSLENGDEILQGDMSNSGEMPLGTRKEVDQQNNNFNSHAKSKTLLNNQQVSPLSQTLKSVKDNILRQIEENRRTSELNNGNKLRESYDNNNYESLDVDNVDQDCDTKTTDNTLSMSSKILNTDKKIKSPKDSKTVQLEDLQKLSDALLKKSLLKEKVVSVIDHKECDDDIESNMDIMSRHTPRNHNKDSTIDSDTSNTNEHITEIKNSSNFGMVPQSKNREDEDRACGNGTDFENSSQFLRTGPDVNEMAVEASEPVIGTQWQDPFQLFKDNNLGSSLFQNIIMQPSSLFEGIRHPPSLDLEGTLNLPTLDDIRQRLSNVFGTDGIGSVVEDFDCSNENPIMSAEPSTSNFISRSPALPLEDLNLDIFQFKSLIKGKSNSMSKIPGVNLKSFKTKVPVPNNFDLKPLRLQSTVGNEGGLLGATLTLGRDSADMPKLFETLGNSAQNLPSLGEIMSKMRENVENLVNTPLDLSRNINHFPSNLRTNTANKITALQERMGSTLGRPNNLLSSSSGKPQEFIERIMDAKEDMEAKLKGLHYDLNDRITSLHDNILDQTGLSSLNPLLRGSSLNRNAFNNNNQLDAAKKIRTQVSKTLKVDSKKDTLGKSANVKYKPLSERKFNSIASQRKFKMPAAASVPIPKTIEAPKLKLPLNKHLSPLRNDPKLRLISSKTNTFDLENKSDTSPNLPSKYIQEKGALGKYAESLKEKKVKVTFGSTTPTPISTTKLKQQSKSDTDGAATDNFRRPSSELVRRLSIKSSSEPNGSPSEVLPTRLRSSTTSEYDNCNADNINQAPLIKDNHSNMLRDSFKEPAKHKTKPSKTSDFIRSSTERMSTSKSPKLPFPALPKVDDNSFLLKVRQAVKDRLSSFDPMKTATNRETQTCPDMERSASENSNVVVGENLKENVSYKCKMVCTKS